MMASDELKLIATKVPEAKKRRFEEILQSRGTNASVFLRQAIYEFIEQYDNEKPEVQLSLIPKLKK
ncbi:hypothetical protein ALP05_04368 [Pseudomonas caricapapayae]|uniref:Ribbon-helix-helix protein CopG domain-containing protein n=1 Tax=Pseudomonas caricapapayae TaxID=46678 RepID=A0A3M6FF95_9PSED|nr:hypothetical protein [Pseudomonas caricapapayae]RMV79113.1 hypothetical protein ALP05_04368 [Pseudomonas caricapapayae]